MSRDGDCHDAKNHRASECNRPGDVPIHVAATGTRCRAGALLRSIADRRSARRDVRRPRRRAAAAGHRARRSHRDVHAEHPAGARDRAGGLEVRRGHRAVQSDAARARAPEDPQRFRQPRSDVPGRSLRRRGARGRAVHRRCPHDHDLGARFPDPARGSAARVGGIHPRQPSGGRGSRRAHCRARRQGARTHRGPRRCRGLHGVHVGHDG